MLIPSMLRDESAASPGRSEPPDVTLKNAPPVLGRRQSDYALLPSTQHRRILILIDAALAP